MRRTLLLLVLATAITVTGCSLIPHRPTRAQQQRVACEQALKYGWYGGVYENCRRQPSTCYEPKNVRCSDGLCMWEGCDGTLVFAMVER